MSLLRWFNKPKHPLELQINVADGDVWLTKFLDLIPKPFFLVDFEANKISFSNTAARNMMGMNYAEHPASETYGIGFSLFDLKGNLVAAENLPSARILQGEKIVDEEFTLLTRAGRFNIKVFSEDIPAMHGRPASALIIFQDITTLSRVKNELNEAVDIAQVGFWSVETTTMKTTISSQLIKQFGLEKDFDGKLESALAVIHPDDRERVTKAIANSMTLRTPYQIEYRVVHSDGSVRWIEAKSGTSSAGVVDTTRFSGTTLDITDRVLARQVLEANERELRLLADSMPQIVWSADTQGQLDYFNQVWFDYSGSTYEDNKGTKWGQYVHPDDVPRTVERWTHSLQTNEPYENEFRLRSVNGSYRWHVARARPIWTEGPNGESVIKKWYGTNTDIHDHKLLTEKLDDARSVAERANSAKSQFLANMSHEIRTPLGAIIGFSELIKENGISRTEREEFTAVISRNSTQLLRIIDDILDLSKVEAGMMVVEEIEFSLPEALTDFASLMGFKAREKGISFNLKALSSLPSTIICDPTRLRQILMNVVGNAIKFTDQGTVEMRVWFENDLLKFEVEDTGRGISPEQEEKLFQPFTQADASTTRKYGGTGLGLVLTRSLTEALGGHFILQKSELGKGSTFAFQVKATAATGSKIFSGLGFETPAARSMANIGLLAGFNILLVEDSPDNQALISIYLNRAGAHVKIASDGDQGTKMATSGEFDVVLMDVQMPVMDGITAMKKLRDLNYSKPVVALTAHAMKEERMRCLQAGFSNFLSKPVNRDELINTIRGAKDGVIGEF